MCRSTKKSVSLAGSWPLVGRRKIFVGEDMKAKDAWIKMSEDHQNCTEEGAVPEGTDEGMLNSAYIQVDKGKSGGKSCVYIYVLRKV